MRKEIMGLTVSMPMSSHTIMNVMVVTKLNKLEIDYRTIPMAPHDRCIESYSRHGVVVREASADNRLHDSSTTWLNLVPH